MSNRLGTQYRLPLIADPEYAIRTSKDYEAGRAGAQRLEYFIHDIARGPKHVYSFINWTRKMIDLSLWMKSVWALSDEELARHGVFRHNIGNLFVKACRS
ncbi:MAG: hypothetical protein ACPGPC_05125 [Alphaproteobacteria bacterium]